MNSDPESDTHLFDRPANRRRLVRLLIAVSAVLLVLDAVLDRHTSHPWDGVFGFYPLYGFVACVVLVLLATQMRVLLGRDEDYYQGSDHRQPTDAAAAGRQSDRLGILDNAGREHDAGRQNSAGEQHPARSKAGNRGAGSRPPEGDADV